MVEYDPVRFKTGLAAALCSKARAFPQGEPVIPVEQYEATFANGELYIKKAPAVMISTMLSLSAGDQ